MRITSLSVGARGQDGFTSGLSDDAVFVIDGESLAYVTQFSLMTFPLTQYMDHKRKLEQLEAFLNDKPEPVKNHPGSDWGAGYLAHTGPDRALGTTSHELEFRVGIPDEVFRRILRRALARQVRSLSFDCNVAGFSTAAFFDRVS